MLGKEKTKTKKKLLLINKEAFQRYHWMTTEYQKALTFLSFLVAQ